MRNTVIVSSLFLLFNCLGMKAEYSHSDKIMIAMRSAIDCSSLIYPKQDGLIAAGISTTPFFVVVDTALKVSSNNKHQALQEVLEKINKHNAWYCLASNTTLAGVEKIAISRTVEAVALPIVDCAVERAVGSYMPEDPHLKFFAENSKMVLVSAGTRFVGTVASEGTSGVKAENAKIFAQNAFRCFTGQICEQYVIDPVVETCFGSQNSTAKTVVKYAAKALATGCIYSQTL